MMQKMDRSKATLGPTAFADMEPIVDGYNWNPWNIIMNKRFDIDVASALHYDWAHTYVCDGIVDKEFGNSMKLLHRAITQNGARHACTYQNLGEYLKRWKWPKGRGNPLHLFDEEHYKRFLNSGDFACSASEFLTLAPVIRRFLQCVALPSMPDDLKGIVQSMILGLEVLDMLQSCKIKNKVDPEKLRRAIKTHMDKFIEMHGEEAVRPKHHYALHLPDMLKKFGVLISTFTHERKHRAVKRYARGRTNLKKFELSVLEEVTCHNMWELTDKYWHAFSTSTPSLKQSWWLQEMFQEGEGFTLHNEVCAKTDTSTQATSFSMPRTTCSTTLASSS
jgi:hypothetical protein